MFLSHGKNNKGELISISEVQSGRTQLTCPFCGQGLLAKRGKIKEHHFSHDGKTCAESQATLKQAALPYYDLLTGLSSAEIKIIDKVAKYRNCRVSWFTSKQDLLVDCFVKGGLLNKESNIVTLSSLGREVWRYIHTSSARNVLPEAKLQETLFQTRLAILQRLDQVNGTNTAKYYQLRLSHILQQHLYVLRIKLVKESICYPLVKVGITGRSDMNERIKEISQDLKHYGEVLSIDVVGIYPHYASLERLLHKKLKNALFEMGSHREYFCELIASPELNHVGLDKLGLRKVEYTTIKTTYRDHSRKVKAGQNRSKLQKKTHLGRVAKSNEQLLADHADIVTAYQNGLSLRKAKFQTGKAINTIRKVYAELA